MSIITFPTHRALCIRVKLAHFLSGSSGVSSLFFSILAARNTFTTHLFNALRYAKKIPARKKTRPTSTPDQPELFSAAITTAARMSRMIMVKECLRIIEPPSAIRGYPILIESLSTHSRKGGYRLLLVEIGQFYYLRA